MVRAQRTIKLVLEYDGGAYAGWQRQADALTIQGVLEDALGRMLGAAVTVYASGRTDAGVHAWGQVAHFHTDAEYPAGVFQNALNALLPRDIAVVGAEDAPAEFHARFSSVSKTYHYLIWNKPYRSALLLRRAWHVGRPLDTEGMRRCLPLLTGTLDFSSFRSSGGDDLNPVRTITQFSILETEPGMIRIAVSANGFLRHMVRNLVGTLVEVGRNKMDSNAVRSILESKDRRLAGPKAPAHGLYLVEVRYPGPDTMKKEHA